MAGNSDIGAHLRKVLSQHGHGFQYAVLRLAEELRVKKRSPWLLEAAEFPVQAGSAITHIDFVLRHDQYLIYMVAECKRADPARARWCFVQAPYTSRGQEQNDILLERITSTPPRILAHAHPKVTQIGNYHLSFELKTENKGDGVKNRPATTDAATQVLRGVNGLINHLFSLSAESSSKTCKALFLPVIFTTAEIWTSDVDLGQASLEKGELPAVGVEKRPWIWFTHNQSAALRHGVPSGDDSASLSDSLRNEFARSIAVVGADAIGKFLNSTLPDWLD